MTSRLATDTGRQRVYDAEQALRVLLDNAAAAPVVEVLGSHLALTPDRRFGCIDSVQRYLDSVLALNWVRAAWPQRAALPVRVRWRAGQQKAHYETATATVALPPHAGAGAWALRELVVLHELAHHLAPATADQGHHGTKFRDCFATMVEEIIGPEAALILRAHW
ncbi:MAG: TIGR04338 family metallohydrolase [Actinomycetota bacterium]|nr:TIGR04338 family metallohydrolase [Actinomycetota bacterium]